MIKERVLRHELIKIAAQLLAATDGPLLSQLRVIVRNDATGTVLSITAQSAELSPTDAIPDQLSPVEHAILRVATREPQTVKKLAMLAGYRVHDHFRSAIKMLENRTPPLLLRRRHGYCLPPPVAKEEPEEDAEARAA